MGLFPNIESRLGDNAKQRKQTTSTKSTSGSSLFPNIETRLAEDISPEVKSVPVSRSRVKVPEVKMKSNKSAIAVEPISDFTHEERMRIIREAKNDPQVKKTTIRATAPEDKGNTSIMPREKDYGKTSEIIASTIPSLLKPDVLPVVEESYNPAEQLWTATKVGTGSLGQILGGSLQRHGIDNIGDRLYNAGAGIAKGNINDLSSYGPEFTSEATFIEKATNPKYLTGNVAPSMPASIVAQAPGLALQLGSDILAGGMIAGSEGIATPAAVVVKAGGSALAGAVSRTIESEIEAGDAYNTAKNLLLEKGYSEIEAREKAKKVSDIVMKGNMKMMGSDILQQMIVFQLPGGKGLRQLPIGMAKLTSDAYIEGIEELTQQIIQDEAAKGKEAHLVEETYSRLANPETMTPEEKEAMTAGAIMALGHGAVGVARDTYENIKGKDTTIAAPVDKMEMKIPLESEFEAAGEIAPTQPAPVMNITQEVQTEDVIPNFDDILDQDLVHQYKTNNMDEQTAYQQLNVDRGDDFDMNPDEFKTLYNTVGTTPEDIDVEQEGPIFEPIPEEAREALVQEGEVSAKVRQAVENHFGVTLPDNAYEQSAVEDDSIKLASEIAKESGLNLVMVTPTSEEGDVFNGFIDQDSNEIYVSDKSDNPVHTVVWHEIGHHMRRTTPEIWTAFKEEVISSIGSSGGVEQWYTDKHQKKTKVGWADLGDIGQDAYTEEFLSDLMQEQSSMGDFYDRLLSRSVDAAKKFVRALGDVINRLRGIEIDKRYAVQPYIEDIERAYNAGVEAISNYLAKENTPVQEVKIEEPKVEIQESITQDTEIQEEPIDKEPGIEESKPELEEVTIKPKEEIKEESINKEESGTFEVKGELTKEVRESIEKKIMQIPDVEHATIQVKMDDFNKIFSFTWEIFNDNDFNLKKTLKDPGVKISDIAVTKQVPVKKTAVKPKQPEVETEKHLLSRAEEVELGRKIKQGDKEARRQFVEANMKLVYKVANQYRKYDIPMDDLVQEGSVGLMHAIDKFDPEKDSKFSTMAVPWIKQSILRELVNKDNTIRIPEHMRGKYNKIMKVWDNLSTELGRKATIQELSDEIAMPVDKINEIIESAKMDPMSLDVQTSEEGEETLGDFIASKDDSLDKQAWNNILRERLTLALDNLDERERQVVLLSYGHNTEPRSYAEIADILGISKQRVGQIMKKAMDNLKSNELLQGYSVDFSEKLLQNVMFSVKMTGFYSKLEEVIKSNAIPSKIRLIPEQVVPEKTVPATKINRNGKEIAIPEKKIPGRTNPAQTIYDQLFPLLIKNGVKREEIHWLGLDNWLHDKKLVTKVELLDFVNMNNVELADSLRVESLRDSGENMDDIYDGLLDNGKYTFSTGDYVTMRYTGRDEDDENPEIELQYFDVKGDELGGGTNSLDSLIILVEEVMDHHKDRAHPKWKSMVLDGGTNYQEKLIIFNGDKNGVYRGGHWELPNVMVHIRFQDYESNNGKVLSIQEIQSDWHQQGSKHGYGTIYDEKLQALEETKSAREHSIENGHDKEIIDMQGRRISLIERQIAAIDRYRNIMEKLGLDIYAAPFLEGASDDDQRELDDAVFELNENGMSTTDLRNGIPNAPFKDTWHELAMKNMVRYAAENGYSYLTFPTAEQVMELEAWPIRTIEEMENNEHKHVYGPIVKRYTKTIPDFLNKYARKWGEQVHSINITDSLSQPGIKINDRMKLDVLGRGQELFSEKLDKDLIAIHNISETNLPRALHIGGFPAPSIAVTREKFVTDFMGKFGDITLVGTKGMIDPTGEDVYAFTADAYTITYPNIRSAHENDLTELRKLALKLYPYAPGKDRTIEELVKKIERSTWDGYESYIFSLANVDAVQTKYIEENSYMRASTSVIERLNQINELGYDKYRAWVRDLFYPVLKDPYITLSNGTNLPYTIENVLIYMREAMGVGTAGTEPFHEVTAHSIRAMLSKNMRSIQEMHEMKGVLKTSRECTEYDDKIWYLIDNLEDSILRQISSPTDMEETPSVTIMDAVQEYLLNDMISEIRNPDEYIRNVMADLGYPDLKPGQVKNIRKIADLIKKMPSDYFEVKPFRIINVSDFVAALVPDKILNRQSPQTDIGNKLESLGLKVISYDRHDANSYRRAIEEAMEISDVLFSKKMGLLENGQRVRSLPITLSESPLYSEEFSEALLAEVIPGGRGAYEDIHLKDLRDWAAKEINKGINAAIKRYWGDSDFQPGQKTALGLYLSMELDRLARVAQVEGDYKKSIQLSRIATDVSMDLSKSLTEMGQNIAAAALATRYDAPSIISKIQQIEEEAFDKLSSNAKKDIRKKSKQITDKMVEANAQIVDEIFDKVESTTEDEIVDSLGKVIDRMMMEKQGVTVREKTIQNRNRKPMNNANLVSKIKSHMTKSTKENDPIKEMVNLMYKLSKGDFSAKMSEKEDSPFDVLQKILDGDPAYSGVWPRIREMISGKYGEDFETPQDFFNYYLSKSSADALLNRKINQTIAGIGADLNNVISRQEINRVVKMVTDQLGQEYYPTINAKVNAAVKDRKEQAAARLAASIVDLASERESKPNKLRDMMNQILRIAREELPKRNIPAPKDPMDLIVQTFKYYRDYQRLWMGAEQVIQEDYKEYQTQITMLRDFFNRPIDDLVTERQLEKVIRKGLRTEDIDLRDLVKKHYTEQSYTISSLADKMIEGVGLKPDDADKLAGMIEDEFVKLATNRKEKILNQLLSEVKKSPRKELIDRIIEYSNLGAFNEDTYRRVICEKIGIPVLTPEVSMLVSDLCNKIQTVEYKTLIDKNGKYEIRWTNTYKYQLLDEGNEVGRYNTIQEAKDHTSSAVKVEWADYPMTVGREYRDELIMELNAFLANQVPSTVLRKISTAQTIGMLLNPRTIIRNTLGNELAWWAERLAHNLAVPMDWTRSKITGEERTITFSSNNALQAYIDGFTFGAKAARKGWTPRGLEGRYDIGRGATFEKKGFIQTVFHFLEKTMRVTLLATDQAAFNRAFQTSLNEQARLMCINNKVPITKKNINMYVETMYDNLTEQAIEYGKRMTYQNDSELSEKLGGFKRFLNGGKDWGFGDIVIKFTKAPANLLLMAIDFSPFGLMKGVYIANQHRMFGGKEPNPREAELALCKALVGTVGFTGFGYWMAMVGIMTGADDDDEKIRMYRKSIGSGAYRFNVSAFRRYVMSGFNIKEAKWKIGEDLIVSYDWMEPLATSVAMGVAAGEQVRDAEDENTLDLTLSAIEGGLGALLNLPLMRGITGLFETPPGERMSGQNLLNSVITKAITEVPASFVPTLSGQFAAYTDDTRRQTWGTTPTETAISRIKNKLPVVSKTLPAQRDFLGTPLKRSPGMESGVVNSFISPAYLSRLSVPKPTQKVISEIYEESKDPTALPGTMDKTLSIQGVPYKLSQDEFNGLLQARGELVDQYIQRFSPVLTDDNTSIDQRVELLSNIYSKAGKTARDSLKRDIILDERLGRGR